MARVDRHVARVLFLHLAEPHKPYAPPERFAAVPPYDGEIAYADEIVGRLVRYLKTHQLYDQSTIILVSDHGEGLATTASRSTAARLRRSLRVPLIVKPAAGKAPAGASPTSCSTSISCPTILDLAKAPVPGNLRGRSLKPLLDGQASCSRAWSTPSRCSARYQFGWTGLTSVTDGRYRFIRSPRRGAVRPRAGCFRAHQHCRGIE